MEWDDVVAALHDAGPANIATADAGGQPHAAVVFAFVEGDGLWFFTTRRSGKARNLVENPRLALMWRPMAEIYLSGEAEIVADIADKTRVWDSGLAPYDPAGFFGTPDNPDLILVRVQPTSATVVSAGESGLLRRTWRR